ncbi:F0F1 ATP synthase subunit epsilon [Sporichthya polymorpha]|uniref:F0F1 ATP synthase subunit epsilon n=1 Tax=Sporichthya polymorpha TaxID=35751 RepID=UPI000367EA3D|nr:F0F1 ATP synthase subunit epsilon [Sporichthya polymorpha]
MATDTLSVDVVAPDRNVYRGPATIVIARTLEGELGILKGHVPVLGVLESGPVTIRTPEGETVTAAVHGGFISVADDVVSILAEVAELGSDIDVARAQRALDRAKSDGDPEGDAAKRAQTRLRAAGREA